MPQIVNKQLKLSQQRINVLFNDKSEGNLYWSIGVLNLSQDDNTLTVKVQNKQREEKEEISAIQS